MYQNTSLGSSKYFLLSYTTIIGSGTRMVRKLNITFTRKNGRLKMLGGQNQKKRKKVSLKKWEQIQRIRGKGLERVTYDPKNVEKFGGIIIWMNMFIFFDIQKKSCIYAVNVISPYEHVLYFLYKCVKR